MIRSPRRHPWHSESGVTLPELLAVFVIVGLVTAFALPKLDFLHYRLDASMRAVGTRLASAQRDAVARQTDVIVTIDTVTRTVRVHWDNDGDHVEDAGEKVSMLTLDDGVVFGKPTAVTARAFGSAAVVLPTVNSKPAIIFHRNGAASASGGFYLTTVRALQAGSTRTDDTRAIQFERSTGRADWYRYRGGAWVRGF